MPDVLVRLHQAEKSYGDLHVLRGLTLEIPRGQHVVIIGPSGSGKTTVLRCLMTLEPLDAGTIQIDGQTVQYERRQGRAASLLARQQRAIRRKVGMVFQQFNLFPHMTALANVTLAPYHVLGISKAQADSEANELLRLVRLADKSAPIPTNFRAVSNSASPSPGRFPCARRSCCSMR